MDTRARETFDLRIRYDDLVIECIDEGAEPRPQYDAKIDFAVTFFANALRDYHGIIINLSHVISPVATSFTK